MATAPHTSPASAVEGLLAATNAVRNLRALTLMLGVAVLAALLFGSAIALGNAFFSGLLALLAFVVLFYGLNAVGIILMREAQGQTCGMVDAILLSLFSGHRLIGIVIVQTLIVVLLLALVGVSLFVCKMPFLGPILLTVVIPVASVVVGAVIFSLFYIVFPLAGPAVWSGSTAFQAIARLNVIIRNRLISVVMQQLGLFFILLAAFFVIGGIMMIGVGSVGSMAAGILGGSMERAAMMFFSHGGMGRFDGAGHLAGAGIGFSVLFAAAASLPTLMAMKGMSIIYLQATQGLNFAEAEAQLETGVAAVKKKAEEARDRARVVAEQQMQRAREAAEAAAAKREAAAAGAAAASTAAAAAAGSADVPPAPAHAGIQTSEVQASSCPKCSAAVAADDAFCGECGHRLKAD